MKSTKKIKTRGREQIEGNHPTKSMTTQDRIKGTGEGLVEIHTTLQTEKKIKAAAKQPKLRETRTNQKLNKHLHNETNIRTFELMYDACVKMLVSHLHSCKW